jgi:glyoxylase I family protein
MTASTESRPPIHGFSHFSATVTDVEASASWYQRVLGLQRLPAPFGLHHNEGNDGHPFDESRTGLDHIAMNVADRAALDSWAVWLDSQGVPHSGVNDAEEPIPYSALIFRDPDNIQLETIHLPRP